MVDSSWVARRVGHGLIFPVGPRAWDPEEVWSSGGKGSMGDIGARRPAAGSEDVTGAGRRPIARVVGRLPEGQAGVL
ncbi:MAG: hypothetical protein ACR2M4_03045 [Actinomycetota bacterium]